MERGGVSMRTRIIERTLPDNRIKYVIQQRHFLFRWWWVDAWINSCWGAYCQDGFDTLEEAKNYMCYFDNTRCIERTINNG